jgi:hypothetical protein
MHARSLRTLKKHQETVPFCVLEGGFSHSHSHSEPTLTPHPRPVANTFILDAFSGRKTWMLTGKSSGAHDDCVFTAGNVAVADVLEAGANARGLEASVLTLHAEARRAHTALDPASFGHQLSCELHPASISILLTSRCKLSSEWSLVSALRCLHAALATPRSFIFQRCCRNGQDLETTHSETMHVSTPLPKSADTARFAFARTQTALALQRPDPVERPRVVKNVMDREAPRHGTIRRARTCVLVLNAFGQPHDSPAYLCAGRSHLSYSLQQTGASLSAALDSRTVAHGELLQFSERSSAKILTKLRLPSQVRFCKVVSGTPLPLGR